jgi:hypothetical protein
MTTEKGRARAHAHAHEREKGRQGLVKRAGALDQSRSASGASAGSGVSSAAGGEKF